MQVEEGTCSWLSACVYAGELVFYTFLSTLFWQPPHHRSHKYQGDEQSRVNTADPARAHRNRLLICLKMPEIIRDKPSRSYNCC